MSNEKPKKHVRVATIAVAVAFILGGWAAVIWGPAEHKAEIVAAVLSLGTVLAALMRQAWGVAALALAFLLPACGSGMTAIGVASASRTAVCLVCEKLSALGACPETSGDSSGPAEPTSP